MIARAVALACLALSAAACAGPFGVGGNAAQLHELAKIKDAGCVSVTGVYTVATVKITAINIDKGIPPAGGSVTMKPDCETTITSGEGKK